MKEQKRKERKYSWRKDGKKANFASQLFRAFIFAGVPVFAAISLCFYIFLLKSSDARLCEQQALELAAVNAKMHYIFTDTESLSEEILYNAAVQEMLEDSFSGQQYPSDTRVSYYINNISANRDYIDGIVITGTDHTLYSTERIFTDQSSFNNIVQKWWFEEFQQTKMPYKWYPLADKKVNEPHELRIGREEGGNRILFMRPVYSMQDYSSLTGYMMIYLKNDYVQQILGGIDWGENTNLCLLDENDRMIACNQSEQDFWEEAQKALLMKRQKAGAAEEQNLLLSLPQGTVVFSSAAFGDEGWHICMITPYSEVADSNLVYRIELLLIIVAFVVVMFIMSRIIARNIARPVMELSQIMDGAYTAGSFEEEEKQIEETHYDEREDEIGQMYRSYIDMRERQETLIQDIYIKDLEKKDAELALLQTQINPHFLYNTLNSINWMALANEQDEISRMITALSDTFRLSLMKNNSPYTELDKELHYIKSYLILQKLRYGSRLEYRLLHPDPVPLLYIPRFILQPVVENALKHGLDSMEEGGQIDIILEQGENEIYLQVINDGDSIDLEKMERILAYDPDEGAYSTFEKEGYGVQNINRRIKLLCGTGFGLSYRIAGGRTICMLKLPIMEDNPEKEGFAAAVFNGRHEEEEEKHT